MRDREETKMPTKRQPLVGKPTGRNYPSPPKYPQTLPLPTVVTRFLYRILGGRYVTLHRRSKICLFVSVCMCAWAACVCV